MREQRDLCLRRSGIIKIPYKSTSTRAAVIRSIPRKFVGSLVIENIEAAAGGEPEIEVIMGIDRHKNLNAVARNLKNDTRQRLQASLENTDGDRASDIPENEEHREVCLNAKKKSTVGRLIFITAGIILIIGLTVLLAWFINHTGNLSLPLIEEYLSANTVHCSPRNFLIRVHRCLTAVLRSWTPMGG